MWFEPEACLIYAFFRVCDDDLNLLTCGISFKFIDGKHAGKVTGTRNMDFIGDTGDAVLGGKEE